MKLTYTKHGDYYLPNIVASEDKEISVNRYGRMHDEYLKKHRNILYNELLLTEQLKADNQLEWIRRMNGIRNRAEEIVLSELIFC